jgi:CRISPR-associated endonuclease Csn1
MPQKPPDLHLAFDVGHSSIGWAVLDTCLDESPALLGCGAVIFPADDCLASQRRMFRRQRRHIRGTRLRIARLKRLLSHLGVLTDEQLDAPGCAWPWLLAARVLRGGKKLTWGELWDVLRWYAHNRGYDGNKGWSRQDAAANAEDTEKEQKAHELLDAFRAKHGREGTMAEVFCDRLGLDPLAEKKSSTVRFRDLGAAFPREGVEAEVERILRAQGLEANAIEALMRDHTAVVGPDYRLPSRYGQRVNGARTPGGLLFGQLVPRFENRIIATCPVQFQREYDRVFAETGDAKQAAAEAEKRAKVPGVNCVEFYRYRWVMQLANVTVATGDARKTRRLTMDERVALNAEMEKAGALTPGEFKKAVRALTGTNKDNLDRLLALPDADKSLVLDPARKLVASGVLGVLWPHLGERLQKHTLTNLRRGKSVTARALLEKCPAAQGAFDHWWDGEAMKTPRKTKKNPAPEARTREQAHDEAHSLGPMNGRAAHSREVMAEVWKFVLSSDGHPMDPDAPLFRSEAIRRAQLVRAIDEQTNNHLVRHRLKLLERLHEDLVKDYAGDDKARVRRITIEVNRNLKELSGKTAQEQAKEQGQQTAQFRSVEKKLAAAYEGLGVKIGPGLIRKGRIAEDLGWKCPYTGASYDELDLLHRRVDKDHIIPRSQRTSDSLDSLIITFSEINKMKGNRTAVQFVEEFQSQPVPGRPNITIKTLTNFLKDVDALETFKGHDDDQRRKKNRQRLLKLRDYVEKEFTPGDLTKTSQLVRLGAEALQRAYVDAKAKPVIVSLPGSVTAAARKSWNLAGCLAAANPNVLNAEDLDENGKPRVHRKTELRGITHLHHALDASIIAFTSHLLPCDGGAWKKEAVELLAKRRCTATEQAQLRLLLRGSVAFTAEGQPQLTALPQELCDQLRARLAERRVVQHLPASMGDMVSDQTVWRLFDPADTHPNAKRLARWLAAAGVEVPAPEAKTVLIITRKRKAAPKPGEKPEGAGGKVFHEGKTWRWVYDIKAKDALLGFAPAGDPAQSKLKPFKAVKVLGDNFGIALDPEPTLIRPLHVWRQLQALRAANGGKWPRVVRKGSIIRVMMKAPRADYRGVWTVRGVNYKQRDGYILGIAPCDFVPDRRVPGVFESASLETLMKCGLEILRAPLCGIAPKQTEE